MILKVFNWSKYFETAKSRQIDRKTWGCFPLKRGLGYNKLVTSTEDDNLNAAMLGGWIALVHVLQLQPLETRNGYLTHDGTPNGDKLTAKDLELTTRIAASVFESLEVVAVDIGWLIDADMELCESPEKKKEEAGKSKKVVPQDLTEEEAAKIPPSKRVCFVHGPNGAADGELGGLIESDLKQFAKDYPCADIKKTLLACRDWFRNGNERPVPFKTLSFFLSQAKPVKDPQKPSDGSVLKYPRDYEKVIKACKEERDIIIARLPDSGRYTEKDDEVFYEHHGETHQALPSQAKKFRRARELNDKRKRLAKELTDLT